MGADIAHYAATSMQQGSIYSKASNAPVSKVIESLFEVHKYSRISKPVFITCVPSEVDIYLADFEKRKGIKDLTFRVCLLPEITPDDDLANGECDLYLDLSKGAKHTAGLLHHFIMRVGKL